MKLGDNACSCRTGNKGRSLGSWRSRPWGLSRSHCEEQGRKGGDSHRKKQGLNYHRRKGTTLDGEMETLQVYLVLRAVEARKRGKDSEMFPLGSRLWSGKAGGGY